MILVTVAGSAIFTHGAGASIRTANAFLAALLGFINVPGCADEHRCQVLAVYESMLIAESLGAGLIRLT